MYLDSDIVKLSLVGNNLVSIIGFIQMKNNFQKMEH